MTAAWLSLVLPEALPDAEGLFTALLATALPELFLMLLLVTALLATALPDAEGLLMLLLETDMPELVLVEVLEFEPHVAALGLEGAEPGAGALAYAAIWPMPASANARIVRIAAPLNVTAFNTWRSPFIFLSIGYMIGCGEAAQLV